MSADKVTKQQLRAVQEQRLHDFLQREDAEEIANSLYSRLYSDPDYLNSQTIGITLSMPGELDTAPIIDQAHHNGKRIAIPRTLPHRQMAFVLLEPDTELVKTAFGTTEPTSGEIVDKADLEMLIVPGLAFSKNHYRVGYGGGFYDRYLADFAGESLALVLPPQLFEVPTWPVESHDILMDKIIY
ncbi:5-formyltetrahydrofolate cyclo-ligase [Lentilactobacillus kisonensis]|uniref:5-formyltetrahydrofolate cyclo-ligase n=2 Tax=Lentilactobacillus kisonensis TaxID=481722 RepID=H1LGH1_9LACO|nr:5-formyltetrahydrofolate cyclo-ligase [Lentilactobacillus kisonensis]EHO51183.1 5-formyltetrahydrofolate cyclo-ligase [Lentilactobacillus kisonensis F0435]KRL23495.1 5-formyltetrahydrofolate cyclo-ligase [Lentilactobacillus kisonensis DSM 19906 = JCM 15041]